MIDSSYKGYRYPKSVIAFAVRYYYSFNLSYRDMVIVLLDRGIEVSHEAVRHWCRVWGDVYGKRIRRARRYHSSDKWHADEVYIKIKGEYYYLWRLLDSNGEEIDILLQKRRDANAAVRFFRKAVKNKEVMPRVLVTDKLKSYNQARRVVMPLTEHRSHKGLNNRAENSHQPTRNKERQLRCFKSPESAQLLLSAQGAIQNLLKVGRYKHSAQEYRQKLKQALQTFEYIALSVDKCA